MSSTWDGQLIHLEAQRCGRFACLYPHAQNPRRIWTSKVPSGLRFQRGNNFARLGVPTQLRFFENRDAIGHDFETTTSRRNHLQLRRRKTLSNFCRQTGGTWLVVSNDAVFDADLHSRVVSLLVGRRVLLRELLRFRGTDGFERGDRRAAQNVRPNVERHQLFGER